MSGGVPMGRQTAIAMMHADAVERGEERARKAVALERREQAEARLQQYYAEHGEFPNETLARQAAFEAQQEAAAEASRAQARREQYEAYTTQLLMSGHRPRTLAEILTAAAGIAP